MPQPKRPWQDTLAIIDGVMKAISGVTDPETLVNIYWDGVGDLLPAGDYLAISRRGVERPNYVITRSSRFTEHLDPWKHRDRLPHLSGGLLAEIAYANQPVIIENLPERLAADEPARFYLEGFHALVALPQYDDGEALNVSLSLFPPGADVDFEMIPMQHWQAGLFGRGTQNLVLRNQLSTALAALDRELQVVGNIQRSLLPRALPEIPGYEFAAAYETSARAGGDYYDFFPLKSGGWGLFIADVSGHGTPAAVLMAITHAIAHAQPGTHTPPVELLTYLNAQLSQSYMRGGDFVTAFYAVLDPANRTLTYSAAGHNPPRLARDGKVIPLDKNGAMPLGISGDETYLQTTIQLERSDFLLLYTDGITETMSPSKEGAGVDLFGVERLDAILLKHARSSAATCVAAIQSELSRYCACAAPADDQTLIAMKCL